MWDVRDTGGQTSVQRETAPREQPVLGKTGQVMNKNCQQKENEIDS